MDKLLFFAVSRELCNTLSADKYNAKKTKNEQKYARGFEIQSAIWIRDVIIFSTSLRLCVTRGENCSRVILFHREEEALVDGKFESAKKKKEKK